MKKKSHRKILSGFEFALLVCLSVQNVYAQSGYTGATGTGTSTGTIGTGTTNTGTLDSRSTNPNKTTTGATTSDEVGSMQSSTLSSDCITVQDQGRVCGTNAMTWCNNHIGALECRNYQQPSSSSK